VDEDALFDALSSNHLAGAAVDVMTDEPMKKENWLFSLPNFIAAPHMAALTKDRRSRRTLAWVLGGRDSTTFRRLYDKVKHLKNCLFYTDNWGPFAEVLPPERHIVGKAHTVTIEQDNSHTRHHWGRFTRRTRIVSKSPLMVSLSIRLWCALTQPETFKFGKINLCIFK
jgi:IS1 family transposase